MGRKLGDDAIPPSGPDRLDWFWNGWKSSASVAFLNTPVGMWDNLPVGQSKPAAIKPGAEKNDWVSSIDTAWRDQAACDGTDLYGFMPLSKREYVQNQSWRPFCDSCPVAKQCLQTGREPGAHGVWGGVFFDRKGKEWDIEQLDRAQVLSE